MDVGRVFSEQDGYGYELKIRGWIWPKSYTNTDRTSRIHTNTDPKTRVHAHV